MLIVILLIPFTAFSENCFTGNIKLKKFGKIEMFKAKYCTNENATVLISHSCASKKCDALKIEKPIDENSLFSEVGKPGFKLCRELKGSPQIVEFNVGRRWFKLDRCLFESDMSFVDTGTLLEHYLPVD